MQTLHPETPPLLLAVATVGIFVLGVAVVAFYEKRIRPALAFATLAEKSMADWQSFEEEVLETVEVVEPPVKQDTPYWEIPGYFPAGNTCLHAQTYIDVLTEWSLEWDRNQGWRI